MTLSKIGTYFRTPKGMLVIALLALIGIAYPVDGQQALPRLGLATLSAVIVDLLFMYRGGKMELPDSALLTGLIVAMVLGPAVPLGVPILASAFAVTSKRIIRGKRGHIFNPAAIGLLITGLLFSSEQSWGGGLGDLPAVLIVAVLAAGAVIANRVNKMPSDVSTAKMSSPGPMLRRSAMSLGRVALTEPPALRSRTCLSTRGP